MRQADTVINFMAAVFTVIVMLSAPLIALAQPLALTTAERAYLSANGKITMCVDPDWEPFERVNEQGEHVGVAADLVRLAASRIGAEIQLVRTADWDESIAVSKAGGCQILSFLNQTPKRDEWLIFTDPIFSDSNVFITREEHAAIVNPADLTGASIVFPKGTAMEERIRRDYPNLQVLVTDTESEAIAMVSDRKADMTMRSLIVAAYTIKKEGLFNLKIAGKLPDYANRLRIGVLKDQTVLRDILNKGVLSITDGEREAIVNRFVSIKIESPSERGLAYKVTVGAGVMVALAGLWGWRLRQHNKRLKTLSQTDALTGIYNRNKIDSEYQREFDRSKRYGRPFSLMIIDIDYFKSINDEFGHVVGDKVIIAIAETIKSSIRNSDIIGRWGGEEFLLLCPETVISDALVVGQRVRGAVRRKVFETGRAHTVSIGAAALHADDTLESLLQRADNALYQAKNSGRDRVRAA